MRIALKAFDEYVGIDRRESIGGVSYGQGFDGDIRFIF